MTVHTPIEPHTSHHDVLLRARSLTKAYNGVTVLDAVDVEFRAGEVHALLGENGAGKSTLVKLLAGVVPMTSGSIDGPAHERGDVAMVFQELSVIPHLSVLDNLALAGRTGGVLVPYRRLRPRSRAVLDAAGLTDVELDQPTEALSLAQQQLLEIARALMRDAQVLILDEPTATLSDVEIRRVHDVVRGLVKDGKAIVYITHRLHEVFSLSHRVTIMRAGKVAGTGPTDGFDIDDVVRTMLGADHTPPRKIVRKDKDVDTDQALVVDDLSLEGRFRDVCLRADTHGVLALFGQVGSGAEDVVRTLAGLCPEARGSVVLRGNQLPLKSRAGSMRRGVAYVPADRGTEGLFLDMTVIGNISSSALGRISRRSVIRRATERDLAHQQADRVRFDVSRLHELVLAFSGGNQQKVAVARALATQPDVLLMSEPTRGVDVGARSEIYATLRQLVAEGVIVVIYTSDIVEIRDVADRVMTLYRGGVVGEHAVDATNDEQLITEILRGVAA